MKRIITAIGLVVTFATAALSGTSQRILSVPSQYKTIQGAINAAKNKDSVLVEPGTYWERLDFMGKEITVASTGGASVTKIRVMGTADVVTFKNSETRASVIEGFDIESKGSYFYAGAAISCKSSSPTIRNNILSGYRGIWVDGSPLIEKNVIHDCCISTPHFYPHGAGIRVEGGSPEIIANVISDNCSVNDEGENTSAWAAGAGIHVFGGNVRIIGNVITGNIAEAVSRGFLRYPFVGKFGSSGGGVCILGGTVLLANNIIAGNQARTTLTSTRQDKEEHSSEGGGVHGGARLINNTIVGNTAKVAYGKDASGGGLSCVKQVTNCIVRDNTAVVSPEMNGVLSVEYSNVKGGWPGTKNINADPLFIDSAGMDFHLRYDSPCRNKGTNTAPNLPSTDYEGDPRIADGTVDMGADEFFPRLYSTGNPTPGGSIQVRFIGKPKEIVILAVGMNPVTANPPVTIPGLTGFFHLKYPFFLVPLGTFSAQGVITTPIAFPKNFPVPSTFPTQALIGLQLSNLHVVKVQ